jgi:hypothetical protein
MAVEPKITKLKPGEGARESGNSRKGRSTPEGTYRMSRNPCIISEGGKARVDPSCKSYLRSVAGRQTGEDMAKRLESEGKSEPDIFMSLVKAIQNREIGWVGAYLDSKNPGRRYTENQAKAIADGIMSRANVGDNPGARLTKPSEDDKDKSKAAKESFQKSGGATEEPRRAMSVRQQRKLPGGRGGGTGEPVPKSRPSIQAKKQTEEQKKYGIDPSSSVQKYLQMTPEQKREYLDKELDKQQISKASRNIAKGSTKTGATTKGALALPGSGAAGARDILVESLSKLKDVTKLPEENRDESSIKDIIDTITSGRFRDKNFNALVAKASKGQASLDQLQDAVDQMIKTGKYEDLGAGRSKKTVSQFQPKKGVEEETPTESKISEELKTGGLGSGLETVKKVGDKYVKVEEESKPEEAPPAAAAAVMRTADKNSLISTLNSVLNRAFKVDINNPQSVSKQPDEVWLKASNDSINRMKTNWDIKDPGFDAQAQRVINDYLLEKVGITPYEDVGEEPQAQPETRPQTTSAQTTPEPKKTKQSPEDDLRKWTLLNKPASGVSETPAPEQEQQESKPKPTDRGFVAPAQARRRGGVPFTVNDTQKVKEQVKEIAKNSGGDVNQFINELNQADLFGSRGYETGDLDNPLGDKPEDPYSRYRGTPAEPGQTGREPTEEEGQGDLFKQEAGPEEKAAAPTTRQVPLRLGGDATQQRMKGQLATVKRREARAVKDINAKASPGSKASKFEQDKETGEWTRKGRKASQGKQTELPVEELPDWQPAPAPKPAPAQASKPAPASSGQGFGNTPKAPARKRTNPTLDKLARMINEGVDRHQKATKKYFNRSEDGIEQMSYEEFSQAVRSMLR